MVDKTKVGFEFPAYTMRVEEAKIAEFAAAVALKDNTNEINPIYCDAEAAKKAGYRGIPVPPTFMTSFFFLTGGLKEIIRTLNIDLGRLLHSEEEYEYLGQIYAGDVITRKMRVVDIYERGKKDRGGRFVNVTVLETEVINQQGKLVGKVRSTMVER
ncbi:MAG: MaoC family dehydratase N-terminal domain-containing protein [Smithellaceae bacterium]|jgi:acyl dehydratase|nr:MaoC family dehydratase N-terminal domain-containing protein [Syntrophaceae bacterium]MDX9816641.1 MaoC family dehydratase N-terminal domain-containing protein [Smithellaceae bacterium]NMD05181.1 MaoC family dehydratase [Deltaproteobacteria bacterium]OPZ54411.1 MAG: hypothetical protein BWY90_00103 [Deltaproteobacteria bacterium ADurb.BinA014]MBP8609320.1 MaoC family dehydratase N-terminal domain-containing protein [Syntrophaceae bacterium]